MIRFHSKKDWKVGVFIWGSVAALILLSIWTFRRETPTAAVEIIAGFLAFAVPVILLLWIWFSTYYVLNDGYISYRSGPFRGRIRIKDIRQIQKKSAPLAGIRPVLSFDAVKIVHRKNRVVYLSPLDKEQLMKVLKKNNPSIEWLA